MINQTKLVAALGAVALTAAVTLASVAAAGRERRERRGRRVAASSSSLDADVVSQWNAVAQAETVLLRPTAHGQSRGIAMVQGAVYDAVNAIDGGYQPYLVGTPAATGRTRWTRRSPRPPPGARRGRRPARLAALDDAVRRHLAAKPDRPRRRPEGSRSAKRPPPRCSRRGERRPPDAVHVRLRHRPRSLARRRRLLRSTRHRGSAT